MSIEFPEQSKEFPKTGILIGVDLGTKTIGLAISNPTQNLATPTETIRRKKFTIDVEKLIEIMQSRNVVGMVFGLPLNMDGTAGPKVQSTKAFIGNFLKIWRDKGLGDMPVAHWDERMSTIVMERELIALDTSRAKRAEKIDEMAACYILQGALDRLQNLDRD